MEIINCIYKQLQQRIIVRSLWNRISGIIQLQFNGEPNENYFRSSSCLNRRIKSIQIQNKIPTKQFKAVLHLTIEELEYQNFKIFENLATNNLIQKLLKTEISKQ